MNLSETAAKGINPLFQIIACLLVGYIFIDHFLMVFIFGVVSTLSRNERKRQEERRAERMEYRKVFAVTPAEAACDTFRIRLRFESLRAHWH